MDSANLTPEDGNRDELQLNLGLLQPSRQEAIQCIQQYEGIV